MPDLLGPQGGGHAGTFGGLARGMPELLGLQGGGMPDLLEAQRGVCRNFEGLRGGYAGTFVGSWGGTPELLWA